MDEDKRLVEVSWIDWLWGKLDYRLTEHGLAHQNKMGKAFPYSQSLASGNLHKPLILIHQRADGMKTTITEN